MLETAPLGKKTEYVETYSPELLCPIPRQLARDKICLPTKLPFHGCDIWHGYELSWIGSKGKPEIALARLTYPCTTPYLVESKSLKLYINSFNQSVFSSQDEVKNLITSDLTRAAEGPVTVELFSHSDFPQPSEMKGTCIDHLDIETDTYYPEPEFLLASGGTTSETLYSHLLKSKCLATGQPDWGTVLINYQGKKIDHEGLLKYLISFRHHTGFAEHCAEQIFQDLINRCCPDSLTLQIFYTRRGGWDISPYRSTNEAAPNPIRTIRQ